MAKRTAIRRGTPPPKPARVTDTDLMGWWKRFVDGEAPFMIAESEQKELSSVEKGLVYIAFKLGKPEVGIERCRLIEHHHKAMVQLNGAIESSKRAIDEIDSAVTDVRAGRKFGEMQPGDVQTWDTLVAARNREVNTQTKLYIEVRNVASALEALFQMKTTSLPVETEDDSKDRGALDNLTHDQLLKLITEDSSIPDAEEIVPETFIPAEWDET